MRFATSLWILLVLSWSQRLDAAENHLAPIVADLSTMARLINGITLQSDFMRSSLSMDPVLAEFLNIGDYTAIPELLKLKVSTWSADVQGLLEAVATLPASTSQSWEGIGTALSVLKSVNVEEIKNATKIDLQPLKDKWIAASAKMTFKGSVTSDNFVKAVEALDYVLTHNVDNSGYDMIHNLKILKPGCAEIARVFTEIKDSQKFNPLWDVIDTQQSFQEVSRIAKLAKNYSDNFPAFGALSQLFLHMKTSVTTLNPVIKKCQQSSIDNKTLDVIGSVFSSLPSQNLLNGLPNGVADLKTLFDDLDGTWLKDQFKGKDMKMLVTALEPLKKFYETLKPVEVSWSELKKFPEPKQVLESVSNLLQYGKLLKQDDLIGNADASSQCVSGLKDISDREYFPTFESFYGGLEECNKGLKKAKEVIEAIAKSKHVEPLSKFFDGMFEFKFIDNSKSAVQMNIDKVKNYTDIAEISQLLNDYVAKTTMIKFDKIMDTLSKFAKGFSIQKSLSETGLVPAIDCLNNANFDLAGTDGFSKFEGIAQTIKSQTSSRATWKTLTSAIQKLQSSEKKLKETVNGMKVSRRRRRNALDSKATGLLKLGFSNQLARDLGDGVQALKEMSEVFKHQDKVSQVANSSKQVDAAIQSIPKMDTMWTVGNKEALKKLVDDVNSLNTKAGDRLKNRSMESIWKVFEDAQNVKGAPIDAHLLADPIYGVLESSTQSTVKTGAAPFKDFPPLQLNFASTSSNLNGASMALQPITTFFADFFSTGWQTTVAPPQQTSESSSVSSSIFIFIGIGVGVIILLVLAGIGGYYWNRRRQWNKIWSTRERHWIYNGFLTPKPLAQLIREGKTGEARRLIREGVFVNTYHEGFTPLHEAVKVADFDVVEELILHGADRNALSIDKQTPEELFMIVKSKYDPTKDTNKVLKAQQELISRHFEKYKKKSFRQKLPDLMPLNEFAIVKPADHHEEIKGFKGMVSPTFFNNTCQMTHCVREVDSEGVFHFGTNYDFAFNAVFGPTVFCKIKWFQLCCDDKTNLHKDYENRVTKVEFKGKIYENIDKLKEYARGRHIPYGRRILLNLLVKDPTEYKDSCRMFKKLGFDCDTTIRTANETHKSHYRPDLAPLIVYDGDSIDEYAEQMKGVNKDDFTIMSMDDFVVYLFEMKIPGGDGGVTTKTQSKVEKSKTEQSKTGDSVA